MPRQLPALPGPLVMFFDLENNDVSIFLSVLAGFGAGPLPTAEGFDQIVADAFTGSFVNDLIADLNALPPANPFSATTAVVFERL